ncbi:MAG: cytochrome c3 family protein [Armatimonadota bacterium]|nr:cytochrome c3 family protein [Armatimonadota bacterium]
MKHSGRLVVVPLVVAGVWLLAVQTAWGAPVLTPRAATPRPVPAPPSDTCVNCHRALGGRLAEPALKIADDIHVRRGFTCAACHGGDPTAAGMESMDPARGFVGRPKAADLPALCGKCHSSPEIMRRFNPRTPTDQAARFLTSVHGQRLRAGDTKVATCTSCHGVHPILAVSDSRSPVFPGNVPATCARCHADAAYMRPYGVPTGQYAEYQASVHGDALLKRGNRQAPACNDCHGNHGAVPPGVASVANVCAQCHASQRDLFARSPHRAAFQKASLTQCTACHDDHGIRRPTDDMVGATGRAICAQCHTAESQGGQAAATMRQSLEALKGSIRTAESVVATAENLGIDMIEAKLPLSDARTQLTLARNLVHSLSLREVQTAVTVGAGLSRKAEDFGHAGLAEIEYRRRGLGVTLAILAVLLIGLILKVRAVPETAEGG